MTAPAVRYTIRPKNPRAHLLEVECTVVSPEPREHWFSLPVWIPGSYLVREFSRHFVEVTAEANGAPVPLEKINKHTWSSPAVVGPLTVRATVYAWDLSVRAAHLDTSHFFFNGTSVFLAVAGLENKPCDVVIEPPSDPACKGWRVATTLPGKDVRPPGFGTYQASSYDQLIDHPVEMGTFDIVEWQSAGVPHQMAVTGRARFDRDRLAEDLAAVCTQHIEMFHGPADRGGTAPMKRYLFLTTALGDGYGGLEHKDSTALICKRDDLPKTTTSGATGKPEMSDGYRGFLGLCSH